VELVMQLVTVDRVAIVVLVRAAVSVELVELAVLLAPEEMAVTA
jgi:hypothetical protein